MTTTVLSAAQALIRARLPQIAAEPLLSNGGRVLHVLDPDAFGWDRVRAEAERYGMLGLMNVDRTSATAGARATFGPDVELPTWDIYAAGTAAALRACAPRTLPPGWTLTTLTHPTPDQITACQMLNQATGVAPAPTYYLSGDAVASAQTMIHDETGALAACGSISDRHHPDGPLARWAFAGAVSVAPEHRGRGLGTATMAALIREGSALIGCTTVYAGVKPDNPASIAMLRACSLIHRPDRAIIVINLNGGYITR